MKRALSMFAVSLAALAALGATACESTPEPVTPVTPPPTVATPPPTVATTPPTAADPATVTEGDVTVAWVNGMEILVKRIPGSEISSSQLYLRGGVRNWTADSAGVEELALSTAASGGTESMDKDAFARKLAELGSELGGGSGNDYASLKAKSLTKEWDATFALLADAFLHPALPPAELEVQRQRQLSGLRHEEESADGELRLLVHRSLFTGHPYANRAVGTKENVAGFKVGEARAALAKLRETGRMLFVAAGDLDPAHVIAQVKAAFGALPRGGYHEEALPPVSFAAARVSTAEKKLPTNYIESVFPAPSLRDADYPVATVAMNVLGYRLFEEVRTKRNLSYAPSAHLSTSLSIGIGLLYVTAVDPNTTMKVMFDELRRIQTEPVPEKELAGSKSTFLTGYMMENEPTDGQAAMLARAQLLGGDWHLAKTLPERIRAVSAADIQRFTTKYAVHLQTTVLGDPSKIDKGLFGSI